MLVTNLILLIAFLAMIGIAVWLFKSDGQQGPDMLDSSRLDAEDDTGSPQQVRVADSDTDRRG